MTKLAAHTQTETTANEALIQAAANKEQLIALERLFQARFEANEQAVSIAQQLMEKRLESMNEFRGALTDQTNRMITRVEALSVLENTSRKIDADVNMLRDRMEQASRPNYPLLIGSLSTIGAILAGVWVIVGLKIEATITPNTLSIVAMEQRVRTAELQLAAVDKTSNDSMQADLVSKSDRIQLNTRIFAIENSIGVGQADRRAKEESTKQKLVEIETQFCASDIVRNLIHANDMRIQSMLWSQTFPGVVIPTDNAYYPKVCNRAAPGAD